MIAMDRAKKAAMSMAAAANAKGKLFREMPEESIDYDSETIETIASLVVSEGVEDMETNVAEAEIVSYLQKQFPEAV